MPVIVHYARVNSKSIAALANELAVNAMSQPHNLGKRQTPRGISPHSLPPFLSG